MASLCSKRGATASGATPADVQGSPPAFPRGPQMRSEREASDSRLRVAQAEVIRLREGERVATVSLGGYFAGGIETMEQLDGALARVREDCATLIGAGKKVIVQ